MRVEAVLMCWVIGCAGKASHSDGSEVSAVAGSAASPSAGRGGGASGGAAGSSSFGGLSLGGGGAEPAGASGSGGATQCPGPAACGIEEDSYVLIEDGPVAARMSAPIDDACAHCRVPCEDCGTACEVSATGKGSCGSVQLKVAVCAGEGQEPPCLNTVAEPAYYIDANGESWPVLSLSGSSAEVSSSPILEGDLTLFVQRGSDVFGLPARVRVCAELYQTLAPCKKVDAKGAP